VLHLVFGRGHSAEAVPDVVAEVIDHPADEDYLSQLRLTIRKALVVLC
jgi:hypothetical protein